MRLYARRVTEEEVALKSARLGLEIALEHVTDPKARRVIQMSLQNVQWRLHARTPRSRRHAPDDYNPLD